MTYRVLDKYMVLITSTTVYIHVCVVQPVPFIERANSGWGYKYF